MVKAGKDTAAGIAEGVKKGRQEGESADGALVVNDHEQFERHLELSVFEHGKHPTNPSASRVVLALSNGGDRPVRVAGLGAEGVALMIDRDDFSHPTSLEVPGDVTVPPHAKVKIAFQGDVDPKLAMSFRLWGKDYKLQ